ncbi:hypothetical protein MPSEU_000006200 [Mayamaea pseudoterrestris]|nr:hypothetical protein MPSEU_000006200 [Mayamaea pseudoterrestris]
MAIIPKKAVSCRLLRIDCDVTFITDRQSKKGFRLTQMVFRLGRQWAARRRCDKAKRKVLTPAQTEILASKTTQRERGALHHYESEILKLENAEILKLENGHETINITTDIVVVLALFPGRRKKYLTRAAAAIQCCSPIYLARIDLRNFEEQVERLIQVDNALPDFMACATEILEWLGDLQGVASLIIEGLSTRTLPLISVICKNFTNSKILKLTLGKHLDCNDENVHCLCKLIGGLQALQIVHVTCLSIETLPSICAALALLPSLSRCSLDSRYFLHTSTVPISISSEADAHALRLLLESPSLQEFDFGGIAIESPIAGEIICKGILTWRRANLHVSNHSVILSRSRAWKEANKSSSARGRATTRIRRSTRTLSKAKDRRDMTESITLELHFGRTFINHSTDQNFVESLCRTYSSVPLILKLTLADLTRDSAPMLYMLKESGLWNIHELCFIFAEWTDDLERVLVNHMKGNMTLRKVTLCPSNGFCGPLILSEAVLEAFDSDDSMVVEFSILDTVGGLRRTRVAFDPAWQSRALRFMAANQQRLFLGSLLGVPGVGAAEAARVLEPEPQMSDVSMFYEVLRRNPFNVFSFLPRSSPST